MPQGMIRGFRFNWRDRKIRVWLTGMEIERNNHGRVWLFPWSRYWWRK